MVIQVKLTNKNNAALYGIDTGGIIEIELEEYVKGVVAAEIGNAHIEACKAQAVAARTAAYPYYSKNKPLSDSSSSLQAFSASRLQNVNTSYPNAAKAVEATRDELLWYSGSVITTCSYCDSNGGRTVSSKQAWGGERAWLIEQNDPWDAAVSGGKRNGHGVGMSQAGAKYAASIGKDYKTILAFYYAHTTIRKEDINMAKTVTAKQFAQSAENLYNTHNGKVKYQNGMYGQYSGGWYLCDCRGYVIWALRSMGLDVTSTGTNWMIRNQMSEVHQVTSASQLEVGQVVFKSKTDISDMPSRYRKGKANYNAAIGEIDVFHVGIVIQTSPALIIRHVSSGGIRTDTKLGNWNWAGYLEWVKKDIVEIPPVPEPIVVESAEKPAEPAVPSKVASDGATGVVIGNGKLNLRKAPSTKAARVEYIPVDDSVTILKANCGTAGWYYVKYNKWSGYVMSDYIRII